MIIRRDSGWASRMYLQLIMILCAPKCVPMLQEVLGKNAVGVPCDGMSDGDEKKIPPYPVTSVDTASSAAHITWHIGSLSTPEPYFNARTGALHRIPVKVCLFRAEAMKKISYHPPPALLNDGP